MGACNSKLHTDKLMLVWPTPVANNVRALFNMVFMDIFELIKYITEKSTEKDRYHLIIPFDCLERLLQSPVYQFPKVLHIYVVYCGISDQTKIEHRYHSKYEKLHFYSMRTLIQQLERDECDRAISELNSIDRITIRAIISLIEDRLFTKRSTDSTHLSQILKQNGSTSLHGYPVKNINDFDACFLCSSCQFVFQQPYRLKCGHRLCGICVNTHKSCAICFKDISLDKVLFDVDLKIKMQKLRTLCFGCEWIGQLKDYQTHLKAYHHAFISCYVYNRQIDEHSFEQQQFSGINGEIFHNNLFFPDPKIIVTTSLDSTCIWKISNVSDLKDNAAPHESKSVYSSPFHIFPNGYKMCFRLYINGDCKAWNTHMSLFIVIMRGEHDNNLRWPFKYKVTLTLIDQLATNDDQRHIIKDFWPNAQEFCTGCPKFDMNDSNGISMFFPLNLFEKDQERYVRNDTMYIKIKIDHLTERPISSPMADTAELSTDEQRVVIRDDDDISLMICR